MNKLERIFDKVLRESQFSIKTFSDGIRYLSDWNNELLVVINDIIGYDSEEILNESENSQQNSNSIAKAVIIRITTLSKRIMNLSRSIDVLIQISNGDKGINKIDHDAFILQINSGIDIMRTVRRMINSPEFSDLDDLLIGLEKNFRKFYNAYIAALNIADPNKIYQRPENYS